MAIFNLKAFIVAGLRRLTYKYPPRYNCMNKARVARGKYKCASCNNVVGRKDIRIDHKIPVVGPEGFQTWDLYINRMFCEEDNFQAICFSCHKEKTSTEAGDRKKFKSKKPLVNKRKIV